MSPSCMGSKEPGPEKADTTLCHGLGERAESWQSVGGINPTQGLAITNEVGREWSKTALQKQLNDAMGLRTALLIIQRQFFISAHMC